MNSLIWQSVMWRPGKLQFLIGVKNPLPIGRPRSPENEALAGPRPSPDSRLRSGYALPSSRIRRHSLILIDVLFSSCLPLSTAVHLGDFIEPCRVQIPLVPRIARRGSSAIATFWLRPQIGGLDNKITRREAEEV